jgi:hypothetical protein
MPNYANLNSLLAQMGQQTGPASFEKAIIPPLMRLWLNDYGGAWDADDIVQTSTSGFSYLFDVGAQRLIAAWGVSQGRHSGARDKGRMAGHPLSAGNLYHRGHAIPHTLGGPTDINLVPQLGNINIGAFRRLEKAAVATPGALYFTYWIYGDASGQTPTGVEQGLLVPGAAPRISHHMN